ncbi:hypothetical protein STEG23_013939, partial [Scotinomys teguina]
MGCDMLGTPSSLSEARKGVAPPIGLESQTLGSPLPVVIVVVIIIIIIIIIKNNAAMSTDSSAIKSTGCICRGPNFDSQYPEDAQFRLQTKEYPYLTDAYA